MTQQDETDQSVAKDQSVPPRPSPYLDASESAPQAYLAPAQPGQPKYGTASLDGTRLPTYGSGSQPYAGRVYGQPSNGQPRFRQAANRPSGPTVPHDQALAAPLQRLAASLIDWIIIGTVSVLPYKSSLLRIDQQWQVIVASSSGQGSPAAQAAVLNFLARPSTHHVILYWALTMSGLALLYYWVQHAAWGATIGKQALGLRVVQANDQRRISVYTAGIRAVTFLAGPATLWILSALASPVSVVGGVLWIADNSLALLDPRAQCLHDKVAGTLVLRKRWLDQQARRADQ